MKMINSESLAGKIIAFSTMKGGVGKTTLAQHLARAWAMEGRGVTLHDLDPIGSALQLQGRLRGVVWKKWGDEVTREPGTLMVIDVPAGAGREMKAALSLADVVVVPVNSNAAEESIEPFERILAQARAVNPGLRFVIALTMVAVRSSHWAELEPRMRRERGEQVLVTTIPRAAAFENAQREKQSLFEYAPRHPATVRLRALAREIEAQVLAGK